MRGRGGKGEGKRGDLIFTFFFSASEDSSLEGGRGDFKKPFTFIYAKYCISFFF